jgi:hypothetical protein
MLDASSRRVKTMSDKPTQNDPLTSMFNVLAQTAEQKKAEVASISEVKKQALAEKSVFQNAIKPTLNPKSELQPIRDQPAPFNPNQLMADYEEEQRVNKEIDSGSVLGYHLAKVKEQLHPTPKPVEVIPPEQLLAQKLAQAELDKQAQETASITLDQYLNADSTAQFEQNIVDGRTTSEAVADNIKDVAIQGGIGLGQVAYGAADLGVQALDAAVEVAAMPFSGASITVPDGSFIPEIKDEVAPIDLGLALDKAGKSTIGVSLRPDFGKTKEIVNDNLSSDSQLASARLANEASSERQANVDAKYLQALAEKGKIEWTDKTAAQLQSFVDAGAYLLDSPVELQRTISESLLSSLAPGAYSAAKVSKLSKEFLKTEEGMKQLAKITAGSGLTVSMAQEGLSNAIDAKERILNTEIEKLKQSKQYRDLLGDGLTEEEAKYALAERAFVNAGSISALVSLASTKLARTGKLEGSGFGLLVDTGTEKGLLRSTGKVAGSTLAEGVQEAAESIGGAVGQNKAEQVTTNPDQDLYKGTGDAAAYGALAGGITAGATTTLAEAPVAGQMAKKALGAVSDKLEKRAESKAYEKEKSEVANPEVFSKVIELLDKNDKEAIVKLDAPIKDKIQALSSKTVLSREITKKKDFEELAATAIELREEAKTNLETRTEEIQKQLEDASVSEDEKAKLEEELVNAKSDYDDIVANVKHIVLRFNNSDLSVETLKKQFQNFKSNDPEMDKVAGGLFRKLGSSIDSFSDDDINKIPDENIRAQVQETVDAYREYKSLFDERSTNEVSKDILGNNEDAGRAKQIRSIKDLMNSFNTSLAEKNDTWSKNTYERVTKLKNRTDSTLASVKSFIDANRASDKQREMYNNLVIEKPIIDAAHKYMSGILGVKDNTVMEASVSPVVEQPKVESIVAKEPVKVESAPVVEDTQEEPTVDLPEQDPVTLKSVTAGKVNFDEIKARVDKRKADKIAAEQEEIKAEEKAKRARLKPKNVNTLKFLKEYKNLSGDLKGGIDTKVVRQTKLELKNLLSNLDVSNYSSETQLLHEKALVELNNSSAEALLTSILEEENNSENLLAGITKPEGVFDKMFETLNKLGSAFKVNNKKISNNLTNIPNFLSTIKDELKKDSHVLRYILGENKIKEEHLEDVSYAVHFVNKFNKSLSAKIALSFKDKSGKDTLSDYFRTQNPLAMFLEEDTKGNLVLNENISTALGYAALVELNNNSTLTSILNDDKTINLIQKKKEKKPVDAVVAKALRDKGTPVYMYADEIGQRVVDMIGISVEGIEFGKEKLVTGLGLAALYTMVEMGLFEVNKVSLDSYLVKEANQTSQNKQNRARNDDVNFIRIKPGSELYEDTQIAINGLAVNGEIIDSLFAGEDLSKSIVHRKPVKATNKIKRSNKKLPADLVNKLQRQNEQPHTIADVADVFMNMDELQQQQLASGTHGVKFEKSHITAKESAEAAGDGIKQEIQTFKNLMKMGLKTFFLENVTYANRRYGIANKIDTMQSKVHRWLVSNANWKTEYDVNNLGFFVHAVVAAFDGKIDVWSPERIKQEFKDIYESDLVQKALDEVDTLSKGEVVNIKSILALNEKYGTKLHLLAGLKALANYRQGLRSNGKFTSDLTLEVDGKTNGFAFSLIQYVRGITADYKEQLNRTGVLSGFRDLAEYYGQGAMDSYQLIAKNLNDMVSDDLQINKLAKDIYKISKKPNRTKEEEILVSLELTKNYKFKEKLKAISTLVGDLVDAEGKVTKAGRNYAKSPLMTWNYNAGRASIARNFATEAVDNFYSELAKFKDKYSEVNTQQERAEISKQYKAYLSNMSAILNVNLKADINHANTFMLTQEQFDKFAVAIQFTYGSLLNTTMQETFPELHNARSAVNDVVYKINEVFGVIYHVEVRKYLNKVKDQGIYHVSKEAHKEIMESIKEMVPSFKGYASEPVYSDREDWMEKSGFVNDANIAENNGFKEGYLARYFGNVMQAAANSKGISLQNVVVNPRELLFGKNTIGKISFNPLNPLVFNKNGTVGEVKSAPIVPEMDNLMFWGNNKIGVAPVLIHNLDAAVISEMMAEFNIYNLNDAVLVAPKDAEAAIIRMNQIFKEVNEKFSISESVYDMASDFSFAVSNYLKNADAKTKHYLENVFEMSEGYGTNEVVFSGLKGLKYVMTLIDARASKGIDNKEVKQKLIDEIGSFGQYGLSGVVYEQNAIDRPELDSTQDNYLNIQEEIKNSLGSSADKMGTFTTIGSKILTTTDQTLQTLEDLQAQDITPTNTEHMERLKAVIEQVGKVMEPVTVLLAKGTDRTRGDYSEETKTARLKLKTVPALMRRGMSDAETFAHEMIHHILEPFVDFKNKHTERLRFLYELARQHIKPEDLIEFDANGNKIANPTQEQIEDAQKMYDYVFYNTESSTRIVANPITGVKEKETKHNGFSEFLAHVATNQNFIRILETNKELNAAFNKGRKYEPTPSNAKSSFVIQAGNFVVELVSRIFEYMNVIQDYFTNPKGSNAHQKAMKLMEQMTQTQEKNLLNTISSYEGKFDLNNKTKDAIKRSLTSEPMRKVAIATNNANPNTVTGFPVYILNKLTKSLMHLGHANSKSISEVIDTQMSKLIHDEQAILAAAGREIQGRNERTSVVHNLRQVSQRYIDAMRINVRTNLKKFVVQDLFKGNLSKATDEALYYGVMKSDLSWFVREGDYTFDQLVQLIESDKNLNARIVELKKQLDDNFEPEIANYYKEHASSLGHYMQTDKHLINCSANNAYLIASLKTTMGIGKTNGDKKLAEKIIDELASIYALKFSGKRKELSELAANNREAFEGSVALQAKSVQYSNQFLFGNNKTQTKKGYVTDITHPKRSLIFAHNQDEVDQLVAQGKELVYENPIPKDPLDPNSTEMYVLVDPVGGLATLNAGVMSFTSETASGTDLIDVANLNGTGSVQNFITGKNDIKTYKDNAMREIEEQLKGNFTKEVNVANPVYTDKGKVVNYRYEMLHKTRVDVLKLQPSFAETIGVTMAHSKDKVNTKLLNRLAVNSLKKDFDKYKDRAGEFKQYVFIGRQSTDPKMRELWHKLPFDTQLAIKDTWGEEGMYVRARSINDVFGFRELRVNDLTESMHKRFNNAFTESMDKLARNSKFMRYEDMTYEALRMAKDIIVVKSGVTGLANIMSNVLLTSMKTGSLVKTITRMIEGFNYTNQYMRMVHEIDQLNLQLEAKNLSDEERKEAISRKLELEGVVHSNPVHFLIKNGVFQTVVEDMDSENDLFSYSTELMDKFKNVTDKVPDVITDLVKTGLMTHDTRLYKLMFKMVQMGDFTARYALYMHNKEEGMEDKQNLDDVMETYVDYDYATHPLISMFNKIGFMIFTKYILRAQKVLVKLAIDKPLTVLFSAVSQYGLGDIEDPYDTMLTLENLLNRLTNAIEIILSAIGETLTLAAIK